MEDAGTLIKVRMMATCLVLTAEVPPLEPEVDTDPAPALPEALGA
jgi:hypothetical protein